MNKRGQGGFSVGTLLALVVAVGILFFIFWGLGRSGGGFSNWWDQVIGRGANIDTVRTSCTTACSQSNKFDFCDRIRDVKFEDATTQKIFGIKDSCYSLHFNRQDFAIDDCPEVDCLNVDVKLYTRQEAFGKCKTDVVNKKNCTDILMRVKYTQKAKDKQGNEKDIELYEVMNCVEILSAAERAKADWQVADADIAILKTNCVKAA